MQPSTTSSEQSLHSERSGMADVVKRTLGLEQQPAEEWHPFTSTLVYRRIQTHFGKLGIPLVVDPQTSEIIAGELRITAYFVHVRICGPRDALQDAGFQPEWFPGSPGQKKTVGRSSANMFGRHREIKLESRGRRGIFAFVLLDDKENWELMRIAQNKSASEATGTALAAAQDNANLQVSALPKSAADFRGRNISALYLLVKGAMQVFSRNDGGYSIAPDDLEEIKRGLRDASDALRNASIIFDERKRQAEILSIVDRQIDSALPVE